MSVSGVLVTGGTGVLGQQVVERLGSAGVEARILSRSGLSGTVRAVSVCLASYSLALGANTLFTEVPRR